MAVGARSLPLPVPYRRVSQYCLFRFRAFLKNSAYGTAFAPLRLGEKWAFSFRRRFSQRRKDAKAAKGRFLLWRDAVTNHPCPPYSPLPHPGG